VSPYSAATCLPLLALGVSLKTAKGCVREVRDDLPANRLRDESHDLDNYLAIVDTVIDESCKDLFSGGEKTTQSTSPAILSTITTEHER
jgi:hypothetical protein